MTDHIDYALNLARGQFRYLATTDNRGEARDRAIAILQGASSLVLAECAARQAAAIEANTVALTDLLTELRLTAQGAPSSAGAIEQALAEARKGSK
jgi:hypothetical protein